MKLPERFSGLREIVLALCVVVSAPICVTWARDAFTTEVPLLVPAPVALMPLGEPEALHTRYGLSIVAMPEPPSHSAMADVHEAGIDARAVGEAAAEGRNPTSDIRYPTSDVRFPMFANREPQTENREPGTANREPITANRSSTSDFRSPPLFVCPDVRAIVTGDDAFAILAWDDSSYVVKPGQSFVTKVGDVKLHRLRPRSLTLTHGDDTLQCSLKR